MEVNKVNSPLEQAVAAQPAPETRFQVNPETAQAVTAVNAAKLFGQDSELTFAMDRESRRTVVRLVDRNTRKLIRQIPPEYVLRLAEDLKQQA